MGYTHLDLAGISLFDAGSDESVPLFAPVFADMGKPVFGIHDTPNKPLDPDVLAKATRFTHYLEIPYKGIETLLVAETPIDVQKRFAAAVAARPDRPSGIPPLGVTAGDDEVRAHVRQLLQARKGSNGGYAALLIAECSGASDLPATLANFLITIDAQLRPLAAPPAAPAEADPDS
jgi:putative ATP-dependent endonuclease of OLD family